MTALDVFDYLDYKAYLRCWIRGQSKGGRGVASELARFIQCQTSHVSQVLNSGSHFSLEQAELVSRFLGHNSDERRFWLLLVQFSRAGTLGLKAVFEEQIRDILQQRLDLKNRPDFKTSITEVDQATYYSSWLYAAVHALVSIEKFQTVEAIGRRLGISARRTREILDFLCSIEIVLHQGGKYAVGATRIHLPSDSPMIAKHHTNWRVRAIQSLDQENGGADLHYSAVVSLSEDDKKTIRSMLVKAIEGINSVVRDSKEERLDCLVVDFFTV